MSVTSTTYDHYPPTAISGLGLAHRRLDAPRRKLLVSELASGRVVLTPMTTTQASVVLGVSPYAVFADRHRRKLACPEPVRIDTAVVTNDEVDSLIRQAGVARVWDRLAAVIS